jgi:voltage-gated potassium channel
MTSHGSALVDEPRVRISAGRPPAARPAAVNPASAARVSWQARAHAVLDPEASSAPGARLARGVLVLVVATSVLSVILASDRLLATAYGRLFQWVEAGTVLVFGLEYLAWLWVAPLAVPRRGRSPWRARLRYAASPRGLVDLLAVLPVLVHPVSPLSDDVFLVLRLARLLKVARYVPALTLFLAVLRNERRPLSAAMTATVVLLVLEAGAMFLLERDAQPEAFASIPRAMWWAIVTIATVGYGDMVPMTAAGRVFGGMVMLLGIAMFAVPAGILASGFAAEIRKREFVVTWQAVAKVPLFARLDAARIAEIARLLRPQVLPASHAVVRRGETAEAMFFVMAGELEVDTEPRPRRLGRGDHFGEIALLNDTRRTATVTTLTECQLLALGVAEFRRLLDANPGIRASLAGAAAERLMGSAAGGSGPGAGR